MANLRGLASIVSELRAERTNLVDRLRHVDAALSVLGKLSGGSSKCKTEPHHVGCGSQADQPRAEKAMGKGERSSAETKAHDISGRQEEDRSRSAGEVGEGEGAEEGGLRYAIGPLRKAGFPSAEGRVRGYSSRPYPNSSARVEGVTQSSECESRHGAVARWYSPSYPSCLRMIRAMMSAK